MTINAAASGPSAAEDNAISRTLRTLLTWHDLQRSDLLPSFAASEDTLARRFKKGGWTGVEILRLAQAFNVNPGDLLRGEVDPRESSWGSAGDSPDPDGDRPAAERAPGVNTRRSWDDLLSQAA